MDKSELPELEKINAEYKQTLQRLQADFENYKKRAAKEYPEQRQLGIFHIIKKLLPVLDSFELSLKQGCQDEPYRKGMELIYAQLYSILQAEGLRPIESAGLHFDPYRHEVILQEQSDKDGIVLEELQKGYMLGDQVLRYSKVKVGKK